MNLKHLAPTPGGGNATTGSNDRTVVSAINVRIELANPLLDLSPEQFGTNESIAFTEARSAGYEEAAKDVWRPLGRRPCSAAA